MISVSSNATETAARFGALGETIRGSVRDAVSTSAQKLAALVRSKLSGDVLNVRSGLLLHSICAEMTEDADGAHARVFSDGSVPYARIQEYGGRLNIPAINVSGTRVLAFSYNGRMVFTKHTAAHVVEIPERSYMRSSLDEFRSEFTGNIQQAVAGKLE
jgi:hypothetical protein